MRYSPESLIAFTEAAALGSFSAAARKLKKSQSTISISIANLESDIGCQLFDRGGRQPILNDAGHLVFAQVKAILEASDGLDALAVRLSNDIEPFLSVVVSDIYDPLFQDDLLNRYESQFPHTELQCGPAEGADVISLLQNGHAHIGMLIAQDPYPQDISASRLGLRTEVGVYISRYHELAFAKNLTQKHLSECRQLCLKTYAPEAGKRLGKMWSAPDHLMLLEFAVRGFGWAELPKQLVTRFGSEELVELQVQGYPRYVDVDIVWKRRPALGPAGQWFLAQLLKAD
ncbi:LysR family transcriptional regulator [Pseudomonas sp. PB3P13]